jgi:chemotaxis signal transduction protein
MSEDQLATEGMLTAVDAVAGSRVVPIRVGGRLHGVPVEQAGDMVILSAIVPVAFAPPCVRGVLNQHGRMATVIDTSVALGLPPNRAQASNTRLIGLTVEQAGHLYILAVDEVREIVELTHAHEPIAPLDIGAIVNAA